MPSSPGHNSDPDPDWEERCHAEASIYVASTSHDHPTTLLECIKVTAENPLNGISRNVVVFFDSGSNRSFLSTTVARDLNLPLYEPISVRVNKFGNELPTTVEGFSTSIVLHSKHRCLPPLAFTACDNIVSSVRTALVEPSHLPKLRRGDLTPSPIQVTPDILIGQDLVSHFKRRYRPSLPHGFYVVGTVLGPLLGGSGKVSPTVPEAAPSNKATITASVTRRSLRMTDATSSSPPLPLDPHREPDSYPPQPQFYVVGNATREYEGQRQSLLRLGRITRNTGKCLVLVVYDEPTAGYDLHFEAIMALRAEVQLPAEHPIHLVAYRASALQLQRWLDTFPNVVFGLEYAQLTCIQHALQFSDHHSLLYLNAWNLLTFFSTVPLRNLALHSGGPSPFPCEHPGHFQTPTILLKAAEAFEQLTCTPKDVLLEHSARTLNTIYGLNINLPDRAAYECDSRNENLSTRLHVAHGQARRADHADQGSLSSRHASATDTAHSVVPLTVRLPHAAIKATCPMCAFCDNPHPSTECANLGTVNKRLGRAEKRKLCTLCLGNGHRAAACPDRTTTPCQHCLRSQHHPALCRTLQQNAAAVAPKPQPHAAAPQVVAPPETTHSVARKAGPTRRSTTNGTFPPAMNHFRVNQPSNTTKADPQVNIRPAKQRSAAVSTPAQAPSKQPSRPRPKRTTVNPSAKHQAHAPSTVDRNRAEQPRPERTSNRQRPRQKNTPKTTHSVGKETQSHNPHDEKKEHSSRDEKIYHRSKKQTRALAEALSTPAVAPVEAHQQPNTAEYRQAHKRKNRKPKK